MASDDNGEQLKFQRTRRAAEASRTTLPAPKPGKASLSAAQPPVPKNLAPWFDREVHLARSLIAPLDQANKAHDEHASMSGATALDERLASAWHLVRRARDRGNAQADEMQAAATELTSLAEPMLSASFRPTVSADILRRGLGDSSKWDHEVAAWKGTPSAEAESPAQVAQRGVTGPGQPLPFRSTIMASFGRHDISGVLAHTDSAAAQAAGKLGASAYAVGNDIAFAGTPDLHTAAHEAAHHVQQRAGVALKGGIDQPGDEYERHADQVAAAVVRGQSAEPILDRMAGRGASAAPAAPVVQRQSSPPKHTDAQDVLPSPVMLQVLGDRFKLTFRRGVERMLYCDVHYEGALPASAPFLKDNTVQMSAEVEDKNRAFNAKIIDVGTNSVTLDVYGDGLTIAKFTDTPSPGDNSRSHALAWKVGKLALGQFSTLTLTLPPSDAKTNPTGGGGKDVATATFKAVDTFTVTARRYGDAKSVAVTIAGTAGVLNAAGQTFDVPIDGEIKKVTATVVSNDGRTIALDLNGDGKADTTLVHTVKETSTSPDGKNALRDHHFRRFDKDGVLVGSADGFMFVFGGPRQTIPKEQDESTNAPDVHKEAPANRPPAQGDTLGELPETVNGPGGVFELRIDGDGDRTKELVLRLKGVPGTGTSPKDKAQIRVDLVQISTGTLQTATFDTTGDAVHSLDPRMSQVANGHDPTIIDVTSSTKSEYGTNPIPLKLFPPKIDGTTQGRTYLVELAGKQINYNFPSEAKAANELVKSATATQNVGNVARFEVTLGELGDRFWVMHEAQPDGKDVFSLVALNKEGPAAARGTPIVGGSAAVKSFQRTTTNPLSFAIDTNGDGKPDIEIFDALSAPTLIKSPNAPLASERDHVITVTGPAIGADKQWSFFVRNGKFLDGMGSDFGPGTNDKQAAAGANATQTLSDQADDSRTKDETGKVTKEGDLNAVLSRVAGALTQSRQKAATAGLINEKLFQAWSELSIQIIQLGPQVKEHARDPAKPVDAKLRDAAAANADVLYTELSNATPADQIDTQVTGGEGWSRTTKTNKITGTVITTGTDVFTNDGPGRRLPDEIRNDKWDAASQDFDRLVLGIDKLIAVKLKPDTDEVKQQQQYLVGMTEKMGEIQGKPGVTRVFASFQPDESYNTNTRKWTEIPLMLFTWKEEGRWWLKDISNPSREPSLDRIAADDGSTAPPRAIFEQLDYARHFPKGIIHYQIPGGDGGQILTTERKHWWEFAQWVGLGAAVIGISLATFGTGAVAATSAAVAFAISGAAGAVYAGGDLYERAKHGDLEPTAVAMDLAQIAAGVFSAGAAITGRIVAAAAQADIAAAKGVQGAAAWSGAAARIAQVAQRAYLPALGAAAAADGVNVLALGVDIQNQIKKVMEGSGSEPDKRAAIVSLLAQGLAMGGITILSIKGSMPEILSGKPTIVIDTINGIPVARANHVEAGGVKMSPKGGADAQASVRWQSHALDEAAAEGMPAAKELVGDQDFMKAYRSWMEQAEPKVVFKDGKPVANFGPEFQARPEIKAKIQQFVDTKGVGISLYEKAWANADGLRKVEAAIAKEGGSLDLQPGSPSWKTNRQKIVQALGGDATAEELVTRYERFRAGANATDVHAYLDQRAQLRTLLPDTDVERLRGMFPEYEVYVTGSATQTGKKIASNIPDIDCVIVVPKGTPPELMAAIEQRARGVRMRPDPEFLQSNGLDSNHTLGLDVKVMTPDEFFGFTTVAPKGRTPLNFTRIDTTPKQLSAAQVRAMSGKDWVEHVRAQLDPDAQARLTEQLKTRSPQQVMDSFHGDVDLAMNDLSTPGGDKPPPIQDTVDMFGLGTIPKSGPPRWGYIENPAHWKPERQALHVKLLAKAKQQALAFAEVLKGGEPTLYAMRGNTAAGKTRAVSNNVPDLANAMSATKDLPHRSVNPDNFKADLIAETPGTTSTQVHSESSMLATVHEKQLAGMNTSDGKKASILIDKRLATVGDVQGYAKMAKDNGLKFVLYDVDAPLENSLAGVLERVPGGADPLPAFDIVAGGFKAVRSNREGVINLFTSDATFGDYVLYGTTLSGQRVEIATVTGGKLNVKNDDLYAVAISNDTSAAEVLTKTRITGDSIESMLKDLPADRAAKVEPILRKYEGWTWKAALDAHSVEKPKVD